MRDLNVDVNISVPEKTNNMYYNYHADGSARIIAYYLIKHILYPNTVWP